MTVLEMRSVRKEYGGVTALADMDLRVERGQIVALLGPTVLASRRRSSCCSV
jgi:ABC-type sugar transport system ATPase subunit